MECLFCRIVKKEIPSSIVYEDEKVLAFNDISPQAPIHILIIPKVHVSSVAELNDTSIVGDIFAVMKGLAEKKGITKSGYRIVVNHGKNAGQAVPHLHFHLLEKR